MIYSFVMVIRSSLLSRVWPAVHHLSIFQRIVIGNSIIILIGAIGGTLLTRHLTNRAADLSLILFLTILGTIISVGANGWIILQALRPLQELRRLFERVEGGYSPPASFFLKYQELDVRPLANGLHNLFLQLEERNQELQALSARAVDAQEEERKRIARSLHDETGQSLSSLIISLERIEQQLPADSSSLKSKIGMTRLLAQNTLDELRQIIYGLRPTILDDLGLAPAIHWYARTRLEDAGIHVFMQAPKEPLPLAPEATTALFRVTQEAIHNILRHSKASQATITLSIERDQVHLHFSDDGSGFDVSSTIQQAVQSGHLGLLGIQERVDLLGGELVIDSAPGQGTRLDIFLPLPKKGCSDDG